MSDLCRATKYLSPSPSSGAHPTVANVFTYPYLILRRSRLNHPRARERIKRIQNSRARVQKYGDANAVKYGEIMEARITSKIRQQGAYNKACFGSHKEKVERRKEILCPPSYGGKKSIYESQIAVFGLG